MLRVFFYRAPSKYLNSNIRYFCKKNSVPLTVPRPLWSSYFFSTMVEATKIQNAEECLSRLKALNIEFIHHQHEALSTMQEIQEKLKLKHAPAIKNLFYSDKKDNHYLVLAKNDTKVEKAFWAKLDVKASNVRIANEDHIVKILGVKKGNVNPFSLANDTDKHVKALVIDEALLAHDYFSFHPLDNTHTVELKKEDFFKFLESIGREYKVIKLDELEQKPVAVEAKKESGPTADDGSTKLCIEYKKAENFSKWYSQVIIKSELIEYYDVSGCYILRPWAYSIWEKIQGFFDRLIKEIGVENAYFPLFVSERALTTEKDHVEGFAPEVAWVTKYGTSTLKEPVAIRPTSETIMYPAFSKWVQSHRDLPILLNQWTNVVRWEFKHPTPFLRTREFLWQEGHTAHSTREESDNMVYTILDFYRRVYEDLMAVPVIKGIKTESEKFAGGFYTTTIETVIPNNGRGIQGATSHSLGQNFSKMFNIEFLNDKGEKALAWQTSWGLTTRTIGVMIMFHSDDKGLVLPPRLANHQVVIVPVPFKGKEEALEQKAEELSKLLRAANIRSHVDKRDIYTPGWKYNHWELKGVPLRLELGPKDFEKQEVRAVKRNDGKKLQLKWDGLAGTIEKLLEEIQNELFQKAKDTLNSKLKQAGDWKEFLSQLNKANVVLTPWCQEAECEHKVKERSAIESKQLADEEAEAQLTGAAKTLCMPLEQDPIKEGEKCFHCGKPALKRVLWGRSY